MCCIRLHILIWPALKITLWFTFKFSLSAAPPQTNATWDFGILNGRFQSFLFQSKDFIIILLAWYRLHGVTTEYQNMFGSIWCQISQSENHLKEKINSAQKITLSGEICSFSAVSIRESLSWCTFQKLTKNIFKNYDWTLIMAV